MAKLAVKLFTGEALEIDDIDLERQTPKELIRELISCGILEPEDNFPAKADGCVYVYAIIDKNNVKMQPESDKTFSMFGFIDGDTIRIVIQGIGI